jgi:hypothetical protein
VESIVTVNPSRLGGLREEPQAGQFVHGALVGSRDLALMTPPRSIAQLLERPSPLKRFSYRSGRALSGGGRYRRRTPVRVRFDLQSSHPTSVPVNLCAADASALNGLEAGGRRADGIRSRGEPGDRLGVSGVCTRQLLASGIFGALSQVERRGRAKPEWLHRYSFSRASIASAMPTSVSAG